MTARTAKKTSAPPAPAVHVVEQLLLDDIAPHPRNVRRDLGDLTELTASIKADGVRNAIHVVPDARDADGNPVTYLVLQGHRRREAAVAAGLATIPAVVRHDVTTDHAAVVEMLVENLLRADLTPIEEAAAYEQLRLAGVTAPQIAKRTGRKRATVDARLALMKLPEQARDAVHAAQLSLDEAAALVEFADDEDTVERLTRAAGTSGFRWQLQEAQCRRRDAKAREATLAQLNADGVKVVARPKDYWSKTLGSVLRVADDVDHEQRSEVRRAAHASCPHHAAFVEDTGLAMYVCLDPTVHRPADGDEDARPPLVTGDGVIAAPVVDEDAARERAEREAAAAQERQDCATAAGVRTTFVRDTVAGRRGVLSAAAAAAIALHVAENLADENAGFAQPDEIAALLEETLPDRPYRGNWQELAAWDTAALAQVRTAMARRGGPAALLASAAAAVESDLDTPWRWAYDSDALAGGAQGRRYLDLLVELGYELTQWEASRLAAIDEHAASAPDDVDEDDEDDDGDERPVEDVDLDGYNAGDDE